MQIEDISNLLNVNSIIIDGSPKSGKMTFVSYLINALFKSKAIIFTPQESYLFNRRLTSLSQQFQQFHNLRDAITPYFFKENWNIIKQKYGYEYLVEELTHLIITSEEKIIVFHRIGEFFEFQDRYEIDNFYKSLSKVAMTHNKKIIFLVNTKNSNYEFIQNVAEEFSDIAISLSNNEKNDRIVNIKNILRHQEYEPMIFRVHENNFTLSFKHESAEFTSKKTKNILIAELDQAHDNIKDICSYIFDKPNFSVKFSYSLQTILEEIFISPDLVVMLMKRTQENFDTIAAIKRQLPNTSIIAILDQEFVRGEDIQEAYDNGCDELFANNLSLETLILVLQKSIKFSFYSQVLKSLHYDNIMKNLDDYKALAREAEEKSLFFTAFTIESKTKFTKVKKSSRHSDYLYQTEYKIYYLALNTMPRDIENIIKNYRKMHDDLMITCIWEPINHVSLELCIS